ncbi:hypothetical protein DAEQUDRAFT_758629 [Daedalea quercina L-15889]|uniref:Uncharacterized protein n=1 Tax=Daedalea quercina L-15889 TaxID=1314783 RepID=A0A165N7U1_9APHY|nr:hypothetical protein DAEQUDRAFT_758629 [Daedalea quercina L-15889]
MNSLFASNRILPTLKRRSRGHSKSDVHTTPTRGTSLDILPELEEEEAQPRPSCSSTHSMPAHARNHSATPSHLCVNIDDAAERKRSSRRVVLTGVEGLTFDDFFPASCAPKPPRPAPAPPLYDAEVNNTSSPSSESPLDSIDLRFSGLGISLNFPSPPLERVSINASPSQSPLAARRRGHSPTSSISSTVTSTTSSSSGFGSPRPRRALATPPTSDDDSLPTTPTRPHLLRAPTCKSHRASIFFAKSMPDLSKPSEESDVESDVDSDVEWYARDISDVVTLAMPFPLSFPVALAAPGSKDPKARPDSIMPVKRARYSKPLPTVPRLSVQTPDGDAFEKTSPSAQLDPTFAQARRRRSFLIPDRPPPPPPIRITTCALSSSSPPLTSSLSPTATEMEARTEELLAELASAALNSGFLGTGLAVPSTPGSWSAGTAPTTPTSAFVVPNSASSMRPPPRMSLPRDIWDEITEDEPALPDLVVDSSVSSENEIPTTPQSVSVYSQLSSNNGSRGLGSSSPVSSFSFDVDVSLVDGSVPVAEDANVDLPAAPDSPDAQAFEPERVLRSRWSSSTLGSQMQVERESFGWISRLTLSPTKKASRKTAPPASPSPKSPTKSMSAFALQSPKSPTRPANPKRYGYVDASAYAHHRGLERRGSRASRLSESSADSGCSSRSDGLRRKPIPVEMFLRS